MWYHSLCLVSVLTYSLFLFQQYFWFLQRIYILNNSYIKQITGFFLMNEINKLLINILNIKKGEGWLAGAKLLDLSSFNKIWIAISDWTLKLALTCDFIKAYILFYINKGLLLKISIKYKYLHNFFQIQIYQMPGLFVKW